MGQTANLIFQYCIVGLVLLGALAWIAWKLVGLRNRGDTNPCCGCSHACSCASKNKKPEKGNECDTVKK